MSTSYYLGRTANQLLAQLCAWCTIIPQRTARERSSQAHASLGDIVVSQNTGFYSSASPTEGTFSKFTAPQNENSNLLLEKRFALFCQGIRRAIYLHCNRPPSLIGHYSSDEW